MLRFIPIFLAASLVAGCSITASAGIRFVDGLYLAVSAVTCTGLVSVSMLELHEPSFVIISFLMLFCNQMMITCVYPLALRWRSLGFLMKKLNDDQKKIEAVRKIRAAVVAGLLTMVTFMLGWFFTGFVLLAGFLRLRGNDPTLGLHHVTQDGSALFLSISAFTQGGFTVTTNSLQYLKNNPLAYISISLIILAGSEQTALLLRWHIMCVRSVAKLLGLASSCPRCVEALDTLLENGEDYNPYLFPLRKTLRLSAVAGGITLVLYILFLVSSVQRPDTLEIYNAAMLTGLGYFQSVSVRFAGFQVINLRRVSQGCLVAYAVAMFIKPSSAISFRDAAWMVRSDGTPNSSSRPTSISQASLASIASASASTAASATSSPLSHFPSPSPSQSPSPARRVDDADEIPPSPSPFSSPSSPSPLQPSSRLRLQDRVVGHAARWVELQLELDASHVNWMLLCFFILAFTEDSRCASQSSPCSFNLFYNAFEVVSAYSNTGVSVGLPDQTYSYSGGFSDAGKVIVMFLMLLGKHRGFPPSDKLCMDVDSEMVAASLHLSVSGPGPGPGPGPQAQQRLSARGLAEDSFM